MTGAVRRIAKNKSFVWQLWLPASRADGMSGAHGQNVSWRLREQGNRRPGSLLPDALLASRCMLLNLSNGAHIIASSMSLRQQL